jgi:hypothetical protein
VKSSPARLKTALLGLLVVLVAPCGCGSERKEPPAAEQAELGGEVAARVGSEVIPLSLVTKVANAQHVDAREALRLLIDDAVTANAARARGLDRERPGAWRLTAARGRFVADRLLAEARKAGPPTDAEIVEMTRQYWREVDRPPTIRVVHGVVRRPKKEDPAAEARAKAFAEELRGAVVGAKDGAEFLDKGKALPHPGVEVVLEALPAFADDGFVSEGEGKMDDAFTKGAYALASVGDTSPIVESQFGWHVIRLVEKVPEQRMPLDARRIAFTDEVYVRRARAATQALLDARKSQVRVEIAPSAEQVMRSLLETSGHGPTP